ncbi:hypothetical protein ABIF64_006539 [Bradyrhizobium japonicum]|nr:hypothetical protein [Bradyrhizobium japonicum]MCP1787771.1 hypothetical protein [Bradyrhizobium japonicum]MCP1809647.1 hypothetical protein [Bradyrhizobium japonicum]MCP1818581.1 hypothetical protein [Bradyrhizobium japonicum]MCP1869909.1 hypothetical protein [Bradyrhizobium japonicum]
MAVSPTVRACLGWTVGKSPAAGHYSSAGTIGRRCGIFGSTFMKRQLSSLAAILSGLIFMVSTAVPSAAQSISAEEAQVIAAEAYVYFYPLVTMDLTRKQLINSDPKTAGIGGPPNTFDNIQAYPTADMRSVVRPNFDTLYSSAWLDLTREPLVVSAPDTGGRYYLLPMLDMWTDVFASPGWRTTGTKAANFLVVPPGWTGSVPADFARIDAPTPYVWIIGRTKTDGPADYAAVHEVQKGYKITPLSGWGKPPVAVTQTIDPNVDVKTPPKQQVDTMAGDKFFAYAAELTKIHPPHITDQPIIARMARIGLEPGKRFDISKVDATVRKAVEEAPAQAQKLMAWKVPTLARVANHWSMNTDTMGVYGNYYLKRAIVAQVGLGANLPEDAIYPGSIGDENGKPLDGANKYIIRFAKDALPPVEAFWSITLYDNDGFQVANPVNRFAVSSWMPFKRDADGSLTIYFQNDNPGGDREANWLPAPKGPFNLTMRLYAPKSDALTGVWNPPGIKRVDSETVGRQQ